MQQGAKYAGAVTAIFLLGVLLVVVGIPGRFAVLLGVIVTPHDMIDTATD